MDDRSRFLYPSYEEWETAWQSRLSRRTVRDEDTVGNAAHFIGGTLYRHGFRLFRNGGTPLAERRVGQLVEEIVINRNPHDDGRFAVHLHLSHFGVRDVRSRYWRPSSRAPMAIGSADVGELEIPPVWTIWDATAGMGVAEAAADWIERLALPWFELFERPEALRKKLYESVVPLVDESSALEVLLAEFGAASASDFLHDGLPAFRERGTIYEITGHSIASSRVRAIAAYYRL